MTFGLAVELLEKGCLVRRTSWSNNDIFVFKQIPSEIKAEIVPKMQSLPEAAKNYFQSQFNDEKAQINAIYYSNQLAIVHKSNLIEGWTPSPADVLATDWIKFTNY